MIDVTAAMIRKDGLVLAARRKAGGTLGGYWEFPGGKIDDGETPKECLARELHEEFGIETAIGAFVAENVHDYGDKIIRLMAYEAEHVAGEIVPVDHDELRWLPPEQLDSLAWAPADVPLVAAYRSIVRTRAFYDANALDYCNETAAIEMAECYAPFLATLKPGAHILDAGCGSGRDSLAFKKLGFTVTAIDASPEVAVRASAFIGQSVEAKSILALEDVDAYDGVWACASLLHCPSGQLGAAIDKLITSLKPGGTLYASFKWGETNSVDDRGRSFTNHTVDSLGALLQKRRTIEILDVGEAPSCRKNGRLRWVAALARKCGNTP